jgi:cardiolipin synthase
VGPGEDAEVGTVTLANRITIFRLFMAPLFIALIYGYSPEREWLRFFALGVYAVAALSDLIDGFIARRFQQQTKLGARLDPLADKLLINLGFVFVAANNHFDPEIPMEFAAVVAFRDVTLVVAAYLINKRVRQIEIKPRFLGKMTAVFQMVVLLAVLFKLQATSYFMYATLVVTLLSLVDYSYIGLRQAWKAPS